ncbi:DoxX family protein [Planococcus dechangensis]|uniref:DoxX family protein n=1 Tax=Planococcus dechangensis TaxID=1176255 RepID=A0ABV9MEW8_9BACL
MLITLNQLLLGLVFVFVYLSLLTLSGADYTARKLTQLGLPKYFLYVTGLVQLVGGSMLLLGVLWHSNFRIIGGAWVAVIMAVGILLRFHAKDSLLSMLPAIMVGILALTIAISGTN